MPTTQIRFDDGSAYDRYMGQWSRLVGHQFLQWLAPRAGLRWLDVGCGNGAFTDMVVERCAPALVRGVDPSDAQLAFARARHASGAVEFLVGDAMALPFTGRMFDVAVMPLVIFFVPDPATGVAEMARVVCADGWVTAYGWDMTDGGFPYAVLQAEMRARGIEVPSPPSPEASRMEAMVELWSGAGLVSVETTEIRVERTFADFDDYWATVLGGPSVGRQLAALVQAERDDLKACMRAHLPPGTDGRITCSAKANAVKGRVRGERQASV